MEKQSNSSGKVNNMVQARAYFKSNPDKNSAEFKNVVEAFPRAAFELASKNLSPELLQAATKADPWSALEFAANSLPEDLYAWANKQEPYALSSTHKARNIHIDPHNAHPKQAVSYEQNHNR